MNLYTEVIRNGFIEKTWNFCHSSGYAGEVFESYYPNGQLRYRSFAINTRQHRDPADGPAYESFFPDGKIYCRQYIFDNQYHRDPADGPAYESFLSNGRANGRAYFIHGEEVFP